jgi:hypothetical protein
MQPKSSQEPALAPVLSQMNPKFYLPCSPLKTNRRFGGTCPAYHVRHAGFLVVLFFEPEDGGDLFPDILD